MKHILSSFALLLTLTVIISCNNSGNADRDDTDTSQKLPRDTTPTDMGRDTSTQPLTSHAHAVLTETQADTVVTGNAAFDTIPGGKVKMVIDVTIPKLPGKSVAVHIHEHGDCGDKGNMAHGHWNPDNKKHGKWGAAEFHSGDIGNIRLDAKGQGKITIETDLWTLGGPNRTNILQRAVVIHSGADDFTSQPSGNSGSRIGCGVIQ